MDGRLVDLGFLFILIPYLHFFTHNLYKIILYIYIYASSTSKL